MMKYMYIYNGETQLPISVFVEGCGSPCVDVFKFVSHVSQIYQVISLNDHELFILSKTSWQLLAPLAKKHDFLKLNT